MKKYTAFLLVMTLMLCLCSCGKAATNADAESSSQPDVSDTESEEQIGSQPEEIVPEIDGDKVGFGYFDLVFPESWRDKYKIETNAYTRNGIRVIAEVGVYEKVSHENIGGGRLFTVSISDGPDFGRFPSGGVIGEIRIDQKYFISVSYPSDYQADGQSQQVQQDYHNMFEDRYKVINSITSDKYSIRIYHSKEGSNYAVKSTIEPAQRVTVTSTGSSAKLTLTEKDGSAWKTVFSCDAAVGRDGVINNVSEQTAGTPKGEFFILFAFGTSSANTGLDYKALTPDSVWVNDTKSEYYNTLQRKNSESKTWSGAEEIYAQFANKKSNYGIAFDFNGNCESGYTAAHEGGSVIFVDGTYGALAPTYGDVAISAADMEKLLSLLDADKNPVIVIE